MSKLTLVPPDPATHVPPPTIDQMTEEQARAYLMSVRSPLLDGLRARVVKMKTSELIAWLANPQITSELIAEDSNEQTHEALLTAAMLAIADEVDRRIPIPA